MDTAHQGAYEADAAIDGFPIEQTTSRRSNASHTGKNAMLVAAGGVLIDEPRPSTDDHEAREDDPLLPRSSSSGNNLGDDEPVAPVWDGFKDFEGLPWYKRPSMYWLLGPFLVHSIAFGGIAVPRLTLYANLICNDFLSEKVILDPNFSMIPIDWNGGENEQCRIPEVESRLARFILLAMLIPGLISAFTSPKLGALSDRYGRKRIIVLTNCGIIIAECVVVMAARYPDTFNPYWILFGAVFDGLSGSFVAAAALVHAYLSDCTAPERRNIAFGRAHACMFTGIALGPMITGYIVKQTGQLLIVFYLALACHALVILFIFFVIPDSLSKRRQLASREKHAIESEEARAAALANPAHNLLHRLGIMTFIAPLKILWPTGPGSSPALRRNLVLLTLTDTVLFGAAMGAITVVIIYVRFQFGWSNYETSVFVSTVNTCRVAALIVVLPLVTRIVRGKNPPRVHGSDRFDIWVIRVSLAFDTFGFLGYSLARSGGWMTVSGVVAASGGFGSPTLQAALTKHVPREKVGQLLGAVGLLHALARVVAPTVFGGIYSATVGKYTQAVFVMLTALFGAVWVVSFFLRPFVRYDAIPADNEGATANPVINEDDMDDERLAQPL